ncbi:response regulator transcription factor [Paenibacillus sp. IB182496]|uniref:Response regulator transcription factor n=1 Tax=Paenibacillus sabuli TaxID=2772509 RepID=A0A927BWB8_9BACL|nr:response regulator [Paenibacillus sabuli]MBD2846548.1 response regulator transcription factor [Paenibacillus sabuli]
MYTVMIVDDERYVRKGLIEMLDWAQAGFRVAAEADNGEDALALIEELRLDLVITDIRMPVLDGIELIQRASARKLDTAFLIISGHNDFRYAQQAVRFGALDYVLKPIDQDELLKAVTTFRQRRDAEIALRGRSALQDARRQLARMLRGEAEAALLAEWEQRWPSAGKTWFAYALVELNDPDPWRPSRPLEDEAAGRELAAAVQEAASVPAPPVLMVHRRALGFVVPAQYCAAYGGRLQDWLAAVLHRLRQRPLCGRYELRAYAGERVETLARLSRAFATAKQQVAFKLLEPGSEVLLHERTQHSELHYIQLEDEVLCKLLEAVEEGERAAIDRALTRLFAEFAERRFSPEAVKAAIAQGVLGIVKTIRGLKGAETELPSMAAMIGWQDISLTLPTLRKLAETFCLEAAELIGRLFRARGRGGIEPIKAYVDAHFHQNISLKSIAAQFYMNAAYLGQLFKKSMGVYFNDYVQQLRMNEAKKLLRQRDLRVYEVAERVGFQNADYFVTVFEKLEHMTPSEYRNRIQARERSGGNP